MVTMRWIFTIVNMKCYRYEIGFGNRNLNDVVLYEVLQIIVVSSFIIYLNIYYLIQLVLVNLVLNHTYFG